MVDGASEWGRCYEITVELEGGRDADGRLVYSNIPGDNGGPTTGGLALLTSGIVTLDADHDGRLDFDLDGDGDVDADDMRRLRSEPEAHREFFRNRYWLASGANDMPWPWCAIVYDAAVHHGPAAAVLMLQRGLAGGLGQDGKVGPQTLARVRTAAPRRAAAVFRERYSLFRRINDRRRQLGQHDFFDAWAERVAELERQVWTP